MSPPLFPQGAACRQVLGHSSRENDRTWHSCGLSALPLCQEIWDMSSLVSEHGPMFIPLPDEAQSSPLGPGRVVLTLNLSSPGAAESLLVQGQPGLRA